MKSSLLLRVFILLFSVGILSSCTMFRPATEKVPLQDTPAAVTEQDSTAEETKTETTEVQIPPVSETLPDTEQPSEPSETMPEPVPVNKVSFIGAGDNIVYYGNVRDAKSLAVDGGREYNFSPAYSDVKSAIEQADIAFINQETLMCGEGYAFSYYPRFNGPQDLGYDLRDIGFDVVNIANNHMLDKGENGLSATIDFWNSMDGITLLGGYKNEEEFLDPRILVVNDIRVAFLSYTFMTNGLSLPSSSSLVIPYPEDDVVISQLSRARELADYVIVSVHWGDENVFTPNTDQRSFAQLLADNGTDAIIGHHPHVIQPIEWMERPDGGQTLCVYSLGNFMAEMAQDYNMLGGLISFDIVKEGDDVRTENVLFTPTVYYFTTSFYQNHIYPLADFTEELASSHGLAYYKKSISLLGVRKYLNNTIDDAFLPVVFRTNETE